MMHICNVSDGYADCYTGAHNGWVARRGVRPSLDLDTGELHVVERWFPSEYCDPRRLETGYATRADALNALERYWSRDDERERRWKGDGMSESITKELREYIDGCKAAGAGCGALTRIADRIDTAHDDEVAHWIEEAHAEDIADISDEELAEHGLVRLPVDADGEAIHFGDTLECDVSEGPFEVRGLVLDREGFVVSDTWLDGYRPHRLHHHRPTPAERIREILDRLDYDTTIKEQPEPLLTIEDRDALYAIADELEADHE